MTVTQRRLRAVFLCAQCASILIFLLGLLLFWFALPVKVQAQSAMVCGPAHGTVDEAMDLAGEYSLEFHQLSPVQADQYIAAILPTRPTGSEGLRAIITVGDRGAILQMTLGGVLCWPHLTVTSQSHERAMNAP